MVSGSALTEMYLYCCPNAIYSPYTLDKVHQHFQSSFIFPPKSTFLTMPQSSCLCGANVIIYSSDPILKFRCRRHLPQLPLDDELLIQTPDCLDERKLTGAAFALNILFSDATLEVLSGKLSTYTKTANSGNTITNHSCSSCGSLLYRSSSGYPGTIVIKAGCIDGVDAASEYVPEVEIFTRSRVPWVQPIAGAKQEPGDFGSSDDAAVEV
jgi:hypothetical protein